ncbi:hypothetical protein BDV95DRAFT_253532 [Massariosphaeria phaeospora]|uniref:Extracellular membrane protein CFEM domain-containing protein n=1 Tax=Massariosphaeria phaeospora TaxID=100035 RepID=A0A7C8I582_9PLEO|nr:hypothetical protein BDV95DRAFT_253532 [Massariosphaeria phaeospora]
MHNFFSQAMVAGLLAAGVTTASQLVALSNFTPQVDNLPSQCQTVYTTKIQGCVPGDFVTKDGHQCTESCVSGLYKIAPAVIQQCRGATVPDKSIVAIFLLSLGPNALCPNNGLPEPEASSTQVEQTSTRPPPPPASTAQEPSPSSTAEIDTDPRASATTLATSSASPTSPTVAPPASTPPPQPTSATGDSPALQPPPAAPSETASSQKSNSGSGGGSPFDVVAAGSSSQLRPSTAMSGAILGMVLALAAIL